MFQFPRLSSRLLGILCLQHSRFPHSDICGSMFVCNSPQLFAAYHVFRRLQKPRHPPYALICFLFASIILLSFITINSSLLLCSYFQSCQWTFLIPITLSFKYLSARTDLGIQLGNLHQFFSYSKAKHFSLLNLNLFVWRIRESNPWPLECKSSALANWANPPSLLIVVSGGLEPPTPTLSV